MIPVKLSMRNFMSYRDNVPPLSFEGIHLACLAGDNGNGKSTLIDAMTWALWGQARAKSDDDLVHTGQAEMGVDFDFMVGKQLYRIIRKRSRPRRQGSAGQSILELQMPAGDSFKSITGNTISQTQRKITEEILHMDYDTFVNSAFLRQGHADDFTNQAPAKRKEVLSSILGLSLYDELEGQAKELSRQQEAEKSQLESAIGEIDDELARKPTYAADLEQAQSELSRIEGEAEKKEAGLNGLREKKQALEQRKLQLEQLEAHIKDTTGELKFWGEQSEQHRSRIGEYEKLISRRSAIEEGYAQFAEARKLCDELNRKQGLLLKLNERQSQLVKAIDSAQADLVKDHALLQSKINELEASSQKLPNLKNQLQKTQLQLRQLAEQEETLRQKKQTEQELQTQVNYLESDTARLEREISEIGEKLDLLSTQTEDRCPLCETELAEEGLKLIESKYTAERESKSSSIQSNQSELARRRSELSALKKEISQTESQLGRDKASSQSQTGILIKEIAESEEAAGQSAGEKERLDGIEQRLAGKDFAPAEQEALIAIESEMARLSYDAERHEQARHLQTGLEQYDQSKRKLDEADRLIRQEEEAATRAEEAAQKLRHSLESDIQKGQSLAAELVLLPQLLTDLAQAETENRALLEQTKQAQETMWSVRIKLERCAELEVKKKEKGSRLAQVAKEANIYKELAQAFGKSGIQALIIETALPEIESEANRLLGRMTDNRMHVKFESQRPKKAGGVIETLDINIADELGTRNYEMFSGGEAFRINFSIRIALSKLLARRAGAPLRTLIIDEGFGTQDSTGLEKLKEAINSIQGDFDKIIVITHIEELRDAFPTRIDVIKTAEGSTLSVS